MPGLSPKEYTELQSLITGPDHGLTPEELERANAAVAAFNEQFESGMRGGVSAEDAMALSPPTQADPSVSREIPGGQDLALKLDPAFPLLPQADATAPNTTHPGGDQAAAMEWMGGQPGGDVTFVYEPPLEVAQKKLLENPQLARTLFENLPDAMSPEAIARMQKGDDAYERVANRMWAETAEAAAKDGKTVYRYSKTPWLHDGKMTSTLQKLGGFAAVAPAAFIMGVDDTGFFGAGRAVNEATGSEEDLAQGAEADVNAPGAALAGQALGVLAPWTATSKLWSFIGSGGKGIAGKLGGGLAARTAASVGAASVAAGADQVAREGAQALAHEGPAQIDWSASMGRVGAAMNPLESPLAPALGAAGEMVGSAANRFGEWTRHDQYRGAVGRLESQGVKFRAGRGPTPPEGAKEALEEGRRLDVDPVDPKAKELAPKLEEGAAKIRAEKAAEIAERNRPFYESREGQMRLPATNTVQTVTEKLRGQFQAGDSGLAPLPGAGDSVKKFRRALNETVEGVSVEPVEGAIELSGEEAAKFLSTRFRRQLEQGEYAGGPVYLIPKRFNAKDHETVIHNYNPEIKSKGQGGEERTYVDRDIAEIRDAAYRDRDARPMNGVEGGWSASQAEARESLKQAEDIQKRVGRGDQAFHKAVDYGTQRPGQQLDMEALQAAADKSGVRNQLDAARALDPWRTLRSEMNRVGAGQGRQGFVTTAAKSAHIRGAYPVAKALESPLGPIRGGTAGRFSLLRDNKLAMPEEEKQEP